MNGRLPVQATRDMDRLRADVGQIASEARAWDERVLDFRGLPDASLAEARAELAGLISRAENVLRHAQEAAPDDPELVGGASIALRRAAGAEAWAGHVLHMRKPPTNVDGLLGLAPDD